MLNKYMSSGLKDLSASLQSKASAIWRQAQAQRQDMSTPAYVYDLKQLSDNIASFEYLANRIEILYATMANADPTIVRHIAQAGTGAFVNSQMHLQVAREAGIPTRRIMYAGSGHNHETLRTVALSGCMYVADSLDQYQSYTDLLPRGLAGLRLNVGDLLGLPACDDPAPRLGLTQAEMQAAFNTSRPPQILHVYAGTNLTSPRLHLEALEALCDLSLQNCSVTMIDLGGGFAFSPNDDCDQLMWANLVKGWDHLKKTKSIERVTLMFEPGRSLVRSCGWYFVKVTDVKKRGPTQFVVVDSSSTWYPRKLVHDADDHLPVVLDETYGDDGLDTYICGCSTYSRDFLAHQNLPPLEPGQVIAFAFSGAYCQAMHLDFLGSPTPEIVFLNSSS